MRIGRRAFLGTALTLLVRAPAQAGPSATVYKDPT